MNSERLGQIKTGFESVRVLVVGDLMVDSYLHVDWSGSEKEPTDIGIYTHHKRVRAPGGAANVALNCHSLGAKTTLFGAAGRNDDSTWLADWLTERKIACPWAELYYNRGHQGITVKTRVVENERNDPPLLRIDTDYPNVIAPASFEFFLENTKESFDLLLLSDYQKGALDAVWHLIDLAKKRFPEIRIAANPKPVLVPRLVKSVDLITLNQKEYTAINVPDYTIDLRRMDLGCRHLLRTEGENGMTVSGEGKGSVYHKVHLAAHPVSRPDIVGAGDSVFAAAGLMLTQTDDTLEIARVANAAGAAKVVQKGTKPVSFEQIASVLGCGI